MLGALEGATPDPNDPATSTCTPPPQRDYTKFLRRDGLKGARIGIPRAFYYDAAATPGERGSRGGLNDAQKRVMAEAIAAMRAQGATVVDPADIPIVVDGRSRQEPVEVGRLQRTRRCQGPRRGLLGGVQVRHEARLQRVAGVARRSRAGEDR